MSSDEMVQSFAEMRLFLGMSEAVLCQLATFAELRRYAADEVLFYEGTCCAELLLLRQGKVQLQMRVPGHGSIPILTLGPGQLVAWSAVLRTGEMTTSAVALEKTEALVMSGAKLKELCEQDRDFGYRFMERLAGALGRRLVATRLQLLDLFANETPRISVEEEQRA